MLRRDGARCDFLLALVPACDRCSGRSSAPVPAPPTLTVIAPAAATWARGGDLVEVHVDHAVVALADGGALAIGGVGATGDARITTVERFDAGKNEWAKRAPLPDRRRRRRRCANARVFRKAA